MVKLDSDKKPTEDAGAPVVPTTTKEMRVISPRADLELGLTKWDINQVGVIKNAVFIWKCTLY